MFHQQADLQLVRKEHKAMFANAKVAGPVAAAKKGSNSKPVETLAGVADVCALEACIKALEGVLEIKKTALKEAAEARLIEMGLVRHSKPDSLNLVEGAHARANVAMRKRSTRSPVSEEELELLSSLVGDTSQLIETVVERPEALEVNPAYVNDEKLLQKVDKLVSKDKTIPEDFIQIRPAVSRTVVSEGAGDAMFRLPAEVAEQIYGILAVTAIRGTYDDLGDAWDIVRPMIAPSNAEVKATLRAQLQASAKAK